MLFARALRRFLAIGHVRSDGSEQRSAIKTKTSLQMRGKSGTNTGATNNSCSRCASCEQPVRVEVLAATLQLIVHASHAVHQLTNEHKSQTHTKRVGNKRAYPSRNHSLADHVHDGHGCFAERRSPRRRLHLSTHTVAGGPPGSALHASHTRARTTHLSSCLC